MLQLFLTEAEGIVGCTARLVRAALIPFGLACCNAPPDSKQGAASAAPEEMRIIYAHERTNVAHVYDLAANRLEARSKANLRARTEFGGPLTYCSSASFRCLRSGPLVAVPRVFPFPPSWGDADYQCELASTPAGSVAGEVHVQCIFRKDQITLFDYSKDRGIVRYRRVCDDCSKGYFELVGSRGLFPASELR